MFEMQPRQRQHTGFLFEHLSFGLPGKQAWWFLVDQSGGVDDAIALCMVMKLAERYNFERLGERPSSGTLRPKAATNADSHWPFQSLVLRPGSHLKGQGPSKWLVSLVTYSHGKWQKTMVITPLTKYTPQVGFFGRPTSTFVTISAEALRKSPVLSTKGERVYAVLPPFLRKPK